MGENLNQQDVLNIQDSWSLVVQAGLKEYGVNMMIRLVWMGILVDDYKQVNF